MGIEVFLLPFESMVPISIVVEEINTASQLLIVVIVIF